MELSLTTTGAPDFSVVLGDIAAADGIAEAVVISLFTTEWCLALGEKGWGGRFAKLAARAVASSANAQRLKEDAEADLSWMVDEGILTSVAAEFSFSARGRGTLRLTLGVSGAAVRKLRIQQSPETPGVWLADEGGNYLVQSDGSRIPV